MKRFINFMTALTVGTTTVSSASIVVSCKGDYMVKLYMLFEKGVQNIWTPADHDNFLIIEADKRDIKKYILEGSDTATPYVTRITFYMKDGSINNTKGKWWSGPKSEYERYFIRELGFAPDIEQE